MSEAGTAPGHLIFDTIDTEIILPTGKWITHLAGSLDDHLFSLRPSPYLRLGCDDADFPDDDANLYDADDAYIPTWISLASQVYPVSLFDGVLGAEYLAGIPDKTFKCITIQQLGVAKKRRRQGVATRIIKKICMYVKQAHYHQLVCVECVLTPAMHSLMAHSFPQAIVVSSRPMSYFIIV